MRKIKCEILVIKNLTHAFKIAKERSILILFIRIVAIKTDNKVLRLAMNLLFHTTEFLINIS